MNLRYGSICSGIEAATVAWHPLGWVPAFFAEIEPFPSAVLAHHYPGVPNLGDMTAIDGAAWRNRIDVLVGGTPCQAFSVAGLRKSLADDRGNLTLKFVELVHAADPFCVVWENVPGVLSTRDNALGCFLAGLVGEGQPLVCRDNSWPNAGMVVGPRRSAAWRVLDAQYFGLAQRRRRVFVVSFRTGDGVNPGAVLFEPESLPRHSPPSREAGARTAGTIAAGAHPGSYNGQDAYSGSLVNALDAHMGMGGPDDNAAQANHLVAALGGGNCSGERSIASALTAKGQRNDFDVETFVTHSLRAHGFDASEDGTGRGTPLVPVAFNWQSGGDCRIEPQDASDMRPCVSAEMAVRRLLPVECEKLQGFPPGYTDVPYRGKPASDGPRYKALGNSMAVPCMAWIGRRIELVLAASRLTPAPPSGLGEA
jgi:DNA (cytosine-5)-methyltransferase 1